MEEEKIKFPEGFFQTVRPTVKNEETFDDVIPMEWEDKTNSDNVILCSKKGMSN